MVSLAPAVGVRWRFTTGAWQLTVPLMFAYVLTLSTLSGLLAGALWWGSVVAVGAAMFAASAVFRMLGARFLVPLWDLLVLLVLLTVFFGSGTAIAGVIPTPSTAGRFLDLFTGAFASINQQGIPATVVPALLFLLVAGAGVVAILFDALAVTCETPALVAVPMVIVLALPATLSGDGVPPFWLVACVAGYLLLLYLARRVQEQGRPAARSALALASASVALALAVATTAPAFYAVGVGSSGQGSIFIGRGINPLIELGKDLRRPAPVPVLSYSTTATSAPYLKLRTLDDFTGTTWRHHPTDSEALQRGIFLGPTPGLSSAVVTTEVTTTVKVQDLQSPWLPVPYPATAVDGLSGEWNWEPGDLTLSSRVATASNQNYTVESLAVTPTAQQLAAAADYLPVSVQPDLELPDRLPSIITKTARAVTAKADTAYDQAVALQNYFHTAGFHYSVDAPVDAGYDGDGAGVIATFLEKKSGYCVHFASAMAIMARVLGIPARVNIGYLPGSRAGEDAHGHPEYEVSSDDLHSWPELYFAGVGWVPFEPTVGRGVVPDYNNSTVVDPTAPSTTPAPATAPTKAPNLPDEQTTAQSESATGSDAATATADSVGVTVAILLLLMLPGGIRLLRRHRRLAHLRSGRSGPADAWLEITDSARDLRLPGPATHTPHAFATRLGADAHLPAAAVDALERIRESFEQAAYGPPRNNHDPAAGARLAEQVQTVVRALMASAAGPRRALAALAPASLLPSGLVASRRAAGGR